MIYDGYTCVNGKLYLEGVECTNLMTVDSLIISLLLLSEAGHGNDYIMTVDGVAVADDVTAGYCKAYQNEFDYNTNGKVDPNKHAKAVFIGG